MNLLFIDLVTKSVFAVYNEENKKSLSLVV